MTLFLIGLGLSCKKDISLKGFEAIRSCKKVYLEYYTSLLQESISDLEAFYEKKIHIADRHLVETEADTILSDAKQEDVAFLVTGDVFAATTHSDLYLRAKEKGITVKVVNNASIMNAVANTGLHLYKFGKTTSLVFFDDNWMPENVYDVVKQNKSIGAHTLVLLDIKVAEPSKKDLAKEKHVPQEPRFMSVSQAVKQLFKLEDKRRENLFTSQTKAIGIARLGANDQKVFYATLQELQNTDFGKPLHSLIIPADLHFSEEETIVQVSQNQ